MKKRLWCLFLVSLALSGLHAQGMQPYEPVPSTRQLQWQQMEFYLFLHFGPNTFTDLEWGNGTEHEEVFNPSALDCSQWCRIAKAAGAKGLIITAKHHDGFCLWPSHYSKHTIAQSKWRNGKGDVLKELSDACREYGLKLGIYLSPWDRNHPEYGTAAYNDIFVNMMKEVVSRYGPLFEFWWDGANGEGPNGKKQTYEWHRFEQTLRAIAPNTPVFSDIGPDIRWVGNESGFAGKTNWDLLDTAGFTRGIGSPPTGTLNAGNSNGKNWIPAECDVSIRPGWFYHAQEDSLVKTPEQLFQLYLKSAGRGASLLLNVPPDKRGLINEHDSASLMGFKRLREESFGKPVFIKNLEGSKHEMGSSFRVSLSGAKKINCIMLKESVQFGQHLKNFSIQLLKDKNVVAEINGTTVGRKRILSFPSVEADILVINIQDTKSPALLKEIAAYLIDEKLVEHD